MWKDHCCYGYILHGVFHRYFTDIFMINRTSTGDTRFLFSCGKIFHLFAVLTILVNQHSAEKFSISKRPCNTLFYSPQLIDWEWLRKQAKSFILLYRQECFTGKYTTCTIHTKLHPGLGWRIFHTLTSEDIDYFTDIVSPLNCTLICCCMIETSSGLPRRSSAIFGNRQIDRQIDSLLKLHRSQRLNYTIIYKY